jgi:hypothetical protein
MIAVRLSEVSDVYQAAISCPHEGVPNSLRNAVKSTSQKMRFEAPMYTTPKSLTAIIVLLEYPELQDPSHTILHDLCETLDHIPEHSKALLTNYFKECSTERYMDYLIALRQHMTLCLLDLSVDGARVAMRALKLLFDALPAHSSVHHSEFYNDGLNNYYFLQRDARRYEFRLWFEDRKRRAGERKSFLSFPFLLTAANKAFVWEVQASVQQRESMAHQYLESIFAGSLPYMVLAVRRDHIIEDTLNCLAGLQSVHARAIL